MHALRDLLAILLGLVSAVALTLWAPAAWTRAHVVDEQGFLAIARPLGGNEAFQQDVADAAVEGVMEQVQVPRAIRSLVRPAIEDQAGRLTSSAAFETIWADSMQDLHGVLMDPGGGTVTADLNPYVDDLVAPVGETLGVEIKVPDADLLRLDVVDVPASPWPARLVAFADAAAWLPWVGLSAAVLALVVAHRRGMALTVLGGSVLVGGALLLLGSQGIAVLVPDAAEDARVVGTLVKAFEARLGQDMLLPSMELMGAGALAVVVALVATGARRASDRRASRREVL